MSKQIYKDTDILQALLDIACDNMVFENEGKNKEINKLYGTLLDDLLEICDSKQKHILNQMDDAVGTMLGNYFLDGVVSGIELMSSVEELCINSAEAYRNLLNNRI